MNRTLGLVPIVWRLLCIFALPAATISAQASEASIESRTAKIDNVQLHYLTAGKGPAVLLVQVCWSLAFGPITFRTQPELRTIPSEKPMVVGLADWKLPAPSGAPCAGNRRADKVHPSLVCSSRSMSSG